MATKLTLTMDERVIEKAKKYASKRGRSLSHLVENYFKLLVNESGRESEVEKSPTVTRLKGILKSKDTRDYKEMIREEIIKKHG